MRRAVELTQESPRRGGFANLVEALRLVERPRVVGRTHAQAEGPIPVAARDLNERPKKSAPGSLRAVGRNHRNAQLGSLGVHEAIGVELGCPEAKPRRTNFRPLLVSDNTAVSRTTPVCQELRELGLLSELGPPRPRPRRVPEERLEQHFF